MAFNGTLIVPMGEWRAQQHVKLHTCTKMGVCLAIDCRGQAARKGSSTTDPLADRRLRIVVRISSGVADRQSRANPRLAPTGQITRLPLIRYLICSG